jgi:hypothetical protein
VIPRSRDVYRILDELLSLGINGTEMRLGTIRTYGGFRFLRILAQCFRVADALPASLVNQRRNLPNVGPGQAIRPALGLFGSAQPAHTGEDDAFLPLRQGQTTAPACCRVTMRCGEQACASRWAWERCSFMSSLAQVIQELDAAAQSDDIDAVEVAVQHTHEVGLSREFTPALLTLLRQQTHTRHEDIVLALQVLKDPRAVDVLYDAADCVSVDSSPAFVSSAIAIGPPGQGSPRMARERCENWVRRNRCAHLVRNSSGT